MVKKMTSWHEKQLQEQTQEEYLSYKITQQLTGKMTTTFEGVVRLLNNRRRIKEGIREVQKNEKIQNQKRKSAG